MKRFISKRIIFFFFLIGLCIAVSCSQQDSDHVTVRSELPDISEVKTELPEAEGYKTFYNSCRMCHSSRYILNQPDFPEETWTAIVTKMQKTYGAPITDEAAQEVVRYLVAIKGKS